MDPQRDELLSAYLDGELPGEQRRQLEQWLDNDPDARRYLNGLQRLRVPSDASRLAEPPPLLHDQVFSKIDAQNRLFGGSLATVAAVLVAAVGYWWHTAELPGPSGPDLEVAVAPDVAVPTGGIPRAQFIAATARSYVLEDRTSEDAYNILLERDEWPSPAGH